MYLAPLGGHRISPTRIEGSFLDVWPISFPILPIVRYSGQEWSSPELLVKWVLSDGHMTGTIVALVGNWSCVSHHQSPVFILLYIGRPSESARRTGSNSRCAYKARCARRNWIHLNISLWYNVPKICESSSIRLSLPTPKWSSERSFLRASADWNDSILKLSSPRLRCWYIHNFFC